MVRKNNNAKKARRDRKTNKVANRPKTVRRVDGSSSGGRKMVDSTCTNAQTKSKKTRVVYPVLSNLSADRKLSNKEKIAILENTKDLFANINSVCDCVELLYDPVLRKSLLVRIVDFMVEIDVNIASEYDSLSEEDWNEIDSMYPTPISSDKNKTLREQIQTFTNIFLKLDSFFKNVEVEGVFNVFEKYVFTSKTRYMQFLMYNMNTEDVLVYFLSALKRNHMLSAHYIAYFSSFLVRRRMDESLVQKAIACFFKYFKDLKNRFLYLSSAQYFLYILCFKQTYIEIYASFIDTLFKGDVMYLNRNIVNVFCSVHNRETVDCFIESDVSRIDQFYFDPPNISRIMKVYESSFLTFDKSKI
ncbi:hypothetical protein THOM_1724 [Trachipleistophora hominis]|uniref:Uncharacterized protein n=1 Tax=Trachipleistophora hominis TaxID=72359 RepID=L7JV32_TRAHO|nr:hypothetical protein THOM_1724 [Trachipleistophora hominis]